MNEHLLPSGRRFRATRHILSNCFGRLAADGDHSGFHRVPERHKSPSPLSWMLSEDGGLIQFKRCLKRPSSSQHRASRLTLMGFKASVCEQQMFFTGLIIDKAAPVWSRLVSPPVQYQHCWFPACGELQTWLCCTTLAGWMIYILSFKLKTWQHHLVRTQNYRSQYKSRSNHDKNKL